MLVSTIPIGGHYIVDLLAGTALWGLAYLLAHALWRGTGGNDFEAPITTDCVWPKFVVG